MLNLPWTPQHPWSISYRNELWKATYEGLGYLLQSHSLEDLVLILIENEKLSNEKHKMREMSDEIGLT